MTVDILVVSICKSVCIPEGSGHSEIVLSLSLYTVFQRALRPEFLNCMHYHKYDLDIL